MAKPVAVADYDTIYTNDPDGLIKGNILANDDANGGPMYLRSLNGTTVNAKSNLPPVTEIKGEYGTFFVKPNGDYEYKLNSGLSVPANGLVEKVGYKISDGSGNTDYDYLTISIKGQHTKPVAVDQDKMVTGDSVSGDLTSEGYVSVSRVGAENTATSDPHDYNFKFVQPDGSTVVAGQYGNLHVERDGTYTYELNDAGHNLTSAASETFQFRIYDDAFGDFPNSQTTDVGILKISIPHDTLPA